MVSVTFPHLEKLRKLVCEGSLRFWCTLDDYGMTRFGIHYTVKFWELTPQASVQCLALLFTIVIEGSQLSWKQRHADRTCWMILQLGRSVL